MTQNFAAAVASAKNGSLPTRVADARVISSSSAPPRLSANVPQKSVDSKPFSVSPHLVGSPSRNLRAQRKAATPEVDHTASFNVTALTKAANTDEANKVVESVAKHVASNAAQEAPKPVEGTTPSSHTAQVIKAAMPTAQHSVPDTAPKAAESAKAVTTAMPAAQHTLPVPARSFAEPPVAPEHMAANSVEAAKVVRQHQAADRLAASPGVVGQAHVAAPGGQHPTHFLVDDNVSVEGGSGQKGTFDDPCSCEFKGLCSCQASIEFMDCIAAACNSGQCDCKATQFQHACTSIAGICTSLDFQCSRDRASCLVERESQLRHVNSTSKESIYEKLRDLKERRCRLELAAEDGWINAEARLIPIREETDELIQDLQRRSEPLPEMHCEKHFEEWHYPEARSSVMHQATAQSALLLSFVSAVLIYA
jgi:hypothetical protein